MKQWVWSAEHSARTWVIAWETILPPFLQDRCHPLSPTSSCWQEPALVSMHWLLLLPSAAPGRAPAGAEGLPGDSGMQLPCRGDGADAGLWGTSDLNWISGLCPHYRADPSGVHSPPCGLGRGQGSRRVP